MMFYLVKHFLPRKFCQFTKYVLLRDLRLKLISIKPELYILHVKIEFLSAMAIVNS